MDHSVINTLGALLAIVSGTGAGLFALLFWHVLRESPFGRVIALLTGTMSVIIVYHVLLFVVRPETVVLDVLRSALYTGVAVLLWVVIATHNQIQNTAVEG